MNGRLPAPLAAAAAGLVTFAVIIAGYAISRSPGDVLGHSIVPRQTPAAQQGTIEYTLAEGANAGTVGDDLQRLGIIRSSWQFQLLVGLMGVQDKLSAGDYDLPRGASTLTIIDFITVKESGPVVRVTFPEGIRVEEMAEIAERAGIGTAADFLAAVDTFPLPAELEAALPPRDALATYRLQGYLFPDTYILPVGAPPAALVQLMVETFLDRFTPEMRAAAAAKGLTLHEAVTLASIVEREAVLPQERPLIAGVFLNRIEAGDIIGADPTTQFVAALDPASVAQFGWWKRELTQEELDNPSPYNTREVAGIPPGPITNPGEASLAAVANAEDTEYYYFVADAKANDGSHRFAVTAAEHDQNIALYGSP